MFIPHELLPMTIAARLKLFLRDFIKDLDLRYSEARKRLILEAQVKTGSPLNFENIDVLADADVHRGKLSVFDLNVIIEWHEYLKEEIDRRLLKTYFENSLLREQAEAHPVLQCIQQRLSFIDQEFARHALGTKPHFFKALRNRWIFGLLREEAKDLLQQVENYTKRSVH